MLCCRSSLPIGVGDVRGWDFTGIWDEPPFHLKKVSSLLPFIVNLVRYLQGFGVLRLYMFRAVVKSVSPINRKTYSV